MNTKYDSFILSLPHFKSQQDLCLEMIRKGINDPERVAHLTGKEKTSIRRAFSELKKAGDIIAIGTVKNLAGTRNIESFKIATKQISLIKF